MKTVTTTSVFPKGYPAEKAIDRIAAAGFDALDMGLDYWDYGPESPFLQPDYLGWAASLRERAEKAGVPYTHAHSPGGVDCREIVLRAIETAAVLGAKYMVVHPVYREEDGRDLDDPERFVRVNAELAKPFVERAEKRGVVLLSENLLDGASADPRNIAALVREVGSPFFGWCYDAGHAHCRGFGPEALRECAAVPLSLHLHDNDGEGDDHLIPGDGNIDWTAVVRELRGAGYAGDCVLEAHHQCKCAPDGERDAILRRLCERGKELKIALTD